MSATFLVPDLHGNFALGQVLLKSQGILNEDGARIDHAATIVQMGDLCNCVASTIEDDLRCLEYAADWFDVYLIGNHELPHFPGTQHGSFFGFWPYKDIEIRLREFLRRGLIRAAHAVDDILLTHAGLAPSWAKKYELKKRLAADVAGWLNERWHAGAYEMDIFTAVGSRRGGFYDEGGILWADWNEPKSCAFRQIVGHTVGNEIRWRPSSGEKGNVRPGGSPWTSLCIDLGGGKGASALAGAWIRDGEVEVVHYRQREEVVA